MNGSKFFLTLRKAGATHGHRLLASSICTAALLVAAPAAAADNRSVRASTTVVEPLTLAKLRDMDFGYVIPPDGGTVVMTYDPDNGSACVASAGLVRGGVCDAAEFAGSGSAGQRVRVRMPAGQEVILTGPGQDMLVSNLDIYIGDGLVKSNNGQGRNRQFRINDDEGAFFFRVGGTLNVNASQAPGLYEGTFTMQIDYR